MVRVNEIAASAVILAGLIMSNSPTQAALNFGDILVGDNVGEYVTQYSSNGTFLRTFTTPTLSYWGGATVNPDGNIVTTTDENSANTIGGGVNVFSPDGTVIENFVTPQVQDVYGCSVFADGTIALSAQSNNETCLYSKSGQFLVAIPAPAGATPAGNFVAADNTLWVAGHLGNVVLHYNEAGTLLNSFTATFGPREIAVDPRNNTLWITDDRDNVDHLTSTGALLGSFRLDFSGDTGAIALGPDDSIYVAGSTDGHISHFSQSGTLLSTFPLNQFVDVVSLTVIPEPTYLGLLATLALPLLVRRRAAPAR